MTSQLVQFAHTIGLKFKCLNEPTVKPLKIVYVCLFKYTYGFKHSNLTTGQMDYFLDSIALFAGNHLLRGSQKEPSGNQMCYICPVFPGGEAPWLQVDQLKSGLSRPLLDVGRMVELQVIFMGDRRRDASRREIPPAP